MASALLAREISTDAKLRLAVLISGSGSGMEALVRYQQNNPDCLHETVLVISDKAGVKGIERAEGLGIATQVIELPDLEDRDERRLAHEKMVTQAIEQSGAEYIILSGYMRLLTADFVEGWYPHIINIHPSLLPRFPGAHAHRDVLASDVSVSGCTVHFVDAGMDTGSIIAQARVPVFADDDESSLAERVKVEEHRLYPHVIDLLSQGKIDLDDGIVTIYE